VVLASLGVGFSYGWWVDKHNRHHAHPNDAEKDPDVAAGALVFTTGQLEASGCSLARSTATSMAVLSVAVVGGGQPAGGQRAIPIRRPHRGHLREAMLMGLHARGIPRRRLRDPVAGKAVAFVTVHQALFGLYLGCCFAPNHKGMPPLSAADDADYLRRQVLTSRNVRGHWITDFAWAA
jgi:hypothetical protein